MKNITICKKTYLIIGFFFTVLLSHAQNQKEADSLLSLYKKGGLTRIDEFQILRKIAKQSTKPEERLQYAQKLIVLASEDTNYLWLHRGYMQKGSALRRQGNLDEAIAAYFQSSEAAKKIDYRAGVGGALLSIGEVYANNNDHHKGLLYRKEAIEVLRTTSDSVTLATALLNTGYGYYLIDNYDSALLLYGESGQIFEIQDVLIGKAYNLGNAGLVYAKQGKTKLAETQLSEAIVILNDLEDSYAITEFQIEMGDIYLKKRNYSSAKKYLNEALGYAIEDGLQERIRDASLKLSELYQTQGDYRKAYNYQSQYITYRDSINNDEVIRKMADLRTEYEVGQKQAEVDLKQTEVDLLNEQARNNQIVLWSVIVILVLVLCLTYALLKVYRVKVRAIRIVKQRRRIIAAQRDQLEDVNRTKDKFFSIISHDIRGPISNFQGVSQLIHMMVETDDKAGLLKLSGLLDTSSKEVSTLLDNLLEWAMSQQGRMPYKPEEIKLHELCNSNLSIMENLATAKQITLTEKVKEKVTITADKNSVSTIIRNLLSNAIKFTPEGGHVDLALSYDLNMAVLTVKDSGIGIPKEKMQHLFDFKGERSRWGTGGEKGVGLGLTLVHEFVELNKGKIEVESEEGQGTTFRVYLPLMESSI
ncbi:ATP-binding protein [Reichenbachiella carrageenanivorans]|uniref:histidine kinase n=1 Tax=Reichenbachiella carrageenanivorans TaxID=2979869 RepID=A0ABY6D9K2_9BACT|nr:ATP-binding protein [Reichenbachiella carrageenanivorans]UXX80555.1 ATP-binding protein [Reichenbachiella carrageenanivorans]